MAIETVSDTITSATVEWQSPSNIALVKYWGKMGMQLPMNPSLSFSLDECATTTSVTFDHSNKFGFEFYFKGEPKPDFHPKLENFFDRILRSFPELANYSLRIDSSNSFPHSSGIASSASAMSALALCVAEFEKNLKGNHYDFDFKQRASNWSRLGSGSACRSVFGGFTAWGYAEFIPGSSDKYAVAIEDVNDVFKTFQDTILLVDKSEKKISSTHGHDLMKGHPFKVARIDQALKNLEQMLDILRNGDIENFVKLVENEALTLHAMMLTSTPGYFLFKPNTLKIIDHVRAFREQKGIPLGFTLDAGANVHLLYPETDRTVVLNFIKDELLVYCQNGEYICDAVGNGPKLIKSEND